MGRQGKRSRTDLASPPKVFGAPRPAHTSRSTFFPPAEAWFWTETPRLCVTSAHFLFSFLAGCLAAFFVIFGGTCGAPRVIAPWRGEREWVPVSNRLYARSLTCARTDGRCVSSGGGDVHTRCPLARPFGGSPPTLAGALPPECIFGSRRTFSLYGCFSALRLHVSQLRPGLYCIVFVFTAVLLTCCVY